RALQEQKITRVGGDKEIKVDVRVIAATNKDLRKEIAAGRFREDLYHRLAVLLIQAPALNERKTDIPLLVNHFLQLICQEYGMAIKGVEKAALDALQQHHWSGNIRELRNVVERLVILSGKQITKADVLQYAVPANFRQEPPLAELFSRFPDTESLHRFIDAEFSAFQSHLG
ncbi:MAG: sigma 54-interacting transcriptional regulator, partial [Haliscomenobacter sp.]